VGALIVGSGTGVETGGGVAVTALVVRADAGMDVAAGGEERGSGRRVYKTVPKTTIAAMPTTLPKASAAFLRLPNIVSPLS
jgi:hypothetical protein